MKLHLHIILVTGLCLGVQQLAAQEKVSVKTATLAKLALYPQRSAPATVVSLNATGVAAEISAKVEAITVRVGDIVKKDQLLIQLHCVDYKLEQAEAEARLAAFNARIDLAQRRLQRTRKLTMKQSVSEELLDERESDLAVLIADRAAAKASLNLTRVHVASCIIKSPFRALVTERTSAVGNYAEVGKTLVRILDIEQLEVSAQVYAQDAQQLEQAGELLFENDGRSYALKLRAILPSINSATRNREIRLLFKGGPALPGAAGKLIWRDIRPHIPGNLIVRRQGELGVFVYENGKVRFNRLPGAQAGRASPTDIALSSLLVTEGQYSLNDNDLVVKQ